MKYCILLVVLAVAGLLAPIGQAAEMEFLADFRPGTLLLGTQTDDFEAVGPNPNLDGTRELEDAGNLSSLPNLKLGVGLRNPRSFLDITGEIGLLVNERFRSLMLGGDVAWLYRYKKNIAFGPHLGFFLFPDPEWTGDAPIDFSDSQGIIGGLEVSIGYDIVFAFSIDYLLASPFDVEIDESWQATDDELDISGLAVQFGMQGRF